MIRSVGNTQSKTQLVTSQKLFFLGQGTSSKVTLLDLLFCLVSLLYGVSLSRRHSQSYGRRSSLFIVSFSPQFVSQILESVVLRTSIRQGSNPLSQWVTTVLDTTGETRGTWRGSTDVLLLTSRQALKGFTVMGFRSFFPCEEGCSKKKVTYSFENGLGGRPFRVTGLHLGHSWGVGYGPVPPYPNRLILSRRPLSGQ